MALFWKMLSQTVWGAFFAMLDSTVYCIPFAVLVPMTTGEMPSKILQDALGIDEDGL